MEKTLLDEISEDIKKAYREKHPITQEEARYYSDKLTFENPDFISYCNKNYGKLPEELQYGEADHQGEYRN